MAPRTHENGGGGATYIIGGGGVVNTNRTDGGLRGLGDEHLGEKLGRRRAEKRKKRDEEKQTEEALKRLMARDGAAQSTGGKYLAQIGVEVGGKKAKKGNGDEVDDRKRAFSAQAIKRIGFDPTLPVGGRGPEDKGKRVSLDEITTGWCDFMLRSWAVADFFRLRVSICSSARRGLSSWVNRQVWVSRPSERQYGRYRPRKRTTPRPIARSSRHRMMTMV